jgi:hypothetical protein
MYNSSHLCLLYDDAPFWFFSCSTICLLQLPNTISTILNSKSYLRNTYYRLGKNRPSSGILVLTSRSALSLHIIAVIPKMTTPITAVFAFQFAGCEYQPPAGDQTCFGYLCCVRIGGRSWLTQLAYGILPPPPCEAVSIIQKSYWSLIDLPYWSITWLSGNSYGAVFSDVGSGGAVQFSAIP